MTAPPGEITTLLDKWSQGDKEALNQLMPMVYQRLHQIAESYMRRLKSGQSLQATVLVHEAYLRLVAVKQDNPNWQGRTYFYGLAAQIMRFILVDQARRRLAAKRDWGQKISLNENIADSSQAEADLFALDEALNRLAQLDPQQCRIVELRFFGGLSIAETAEFLNISATTVKEDWRLAKAWLRRELGL
ncbi:MAG: sigma-70 family RNA polymerase sigma factor [Acidobacteriota bacterium]